MIWLWRICFSALLLFPLSAATVIGKVQLLNSKEKAVQRGLDYSGVVVWLEAAGGAAPVPKTPGRATMLQKNKRFIPHVLAVRTGTIVDFPNHDPIFHNAFSNFSGQIFDVGLYKPGSSRSVPFSRQGIVRVFCNIHANMSAVIVVLNTHWFATSAIDGTFRIADVPPGEYRLKVFHERATAQELAKLERTVRVNGNDATALPPIAISEAGHLTAPHLNKHGEPYGSSPDSYKVMR